VLQVAPAKTVQQALRKKLAAALVAKAKKLAPVAK